MLPRVTVRMYWWFLVGSLTVVSLGAFTWLPALVSAAETQAEQAVLGSKQFFWTDSTSTLGLTEFGTISSLDFPHGFEHLGLDPLEGFALCYSILCPDDDPTGAEAQPVFYVGSAASFGALPPPPSQPQVLPCGAHGDIVNVLFSQRPKGERDCPGAEIKKLRAVSVNKTCDGALSIHNIIEWVKGEKRVKVKMLIRNRTRDCEIELLSVKRYADLDTDCRPGCEGLDTQCPQAGTEGCLNRFCRTSSSVFASNDPDDCDEQEVHSVVMTGLNPTPTHTLISGLEDEKFDNLVTCDPVGVDEDACCTPADRTATLQWGTPDEPLAVLEPRTGRVTIEMVYEIK